MGTPRPITVQPSNGSNGVQWVLCDVTASNCGGPGANPPTPYPVIDLPKNKVGYDFTVTIKNAAGISFAPANKPTTYPQTGDAALWVMMGQGQHPSHQGNNSNGQIVNPQLTDATTLTFTDLNHGQGVSWLSYRLNFVKNGSQAVNPIDPDIKNGGSAFWGAAPGTSSAMMTAAVTAAIVALVVAAIVAYIVARRR